MEIQKPYNQANLADDLEKLALQIRSQDPQRLLNVLEHADLEDGFAECVSALLAYTTPATEKESAAQEYVDGAMGQAEEPFHWPDVGEPDFMITVDFDCPNYPASWGDLVLRAGEQEIYRRPTWYENADHLSMACKDMRKAYKGRVKGYVVTDAAKSTLYGDDFRAPGKVRKAFRKIMKDYQKKRERQNS